MRAATISHPPPDTAVHITTRATANQSDSTSAGSAPTVPLRHSGQTQRGRTRQPVRPVSGLGLATASPTRAPAAAAGAPTGHRTPLLADSRAQRLHTQPLLPQLGHPVTEKRL